MNPSTFIVTATALTLAFRAAMATDFYVAPNGSDANPGTQPKPFATLEAARDAIRTLKQSGELPSGGVTVWLRAGDFCRTNALELAVADSGSPASPIVWRAAVGETVRLLGGRKLDGFKPVTDPAVRKRLDPKARDQVAQCDLQALGLTLFGEMKSRGFGRPTTPAHWAMFIGGGRDHRVENNLFVDCDPAVRMDGRGRDPSPVWRNMVHDYMRQRLAEMPSALYRDRYPALRPSTPTTARPAAQPSPARTSKACRRKTKAHICSSIRFDSSTRSGLDTIHLLQTTANLVPPITWEFACALTPDAMV